MQLHCSPKKKHSFWHFVTQIHYKFIKNLKNEFCAKSACVGAEIEIFARKTAASTPTLQSIVFIFNIVTESNGAFSCHFVFLFDIIRLQHWFFKMEDHRPNYGLLDYLLELRALIEIHPTLVHKTY